MYEKIEHYTIYGIKILNDHWKQSTMVVIIKRDGILSSHPVCCQGQMKKDPLIQHRNLVDVFVS